MKHSVARTLLTLATLAGAACVQVEESDCCGEGGCEAQWSGSSGGWSTSSSGSWGDVGGTGAFCEGVGGCGTGEVCSPTDSCETIVADCPLTEECLADPGMQTEDWQGTDPWFTGTFTATGLAGRLKADLEFYPDHLYGDGELVMEGENQWDWASVLVTGVRDGNTFTGQVVDKYGGRNFDLTFTATLLSGSELRGEFQVLDEHGTRRGALELWRTSPCGCSTEADGGTPDAGTVTTQCRRNSDCANGGVCIDGSCQQCFTSADCAAGLACVNYACVVPGTCTTNNECPANQACVGGSCHNTCDHRCDCPAGEACENGTCTATPNEPPPRTCTTDCECDYNAGERCVQGVCG